MIEDRFSSTQRHCDATVPSSQRGRNPTRKLRLAWAVLAVCVALPVTSVTAAAQDSDKAPPTTVPADTSQPRHDATEHVRWREVYVNGSTLLSDGQTGSTGNIRGKWRYYGNWDDPAAQPYVHSPTDSRVVPVKERYYNDHWIYHWPANRWEKLDNGLDTKQWVRLTGWVIHADWAGGSWGGNAAYEYHYGQRTRSGTLPELHHHWYDQIYQIVCATLSLASTVVSVAAIIGTVGLSGGAAFLFLANGIACFKAAVDQFFRDEPLGSVYVKGESTWLVETDGATETVRVRVPVTRSILAVAGLPYTHHRRTAWRKADHE